jgi:hypothetical protein
MSAVAIEINDAGLALADESGVLAVEPGYALVANGAILTGLEALRQARRKPRQVSNRHWAVLSLEAGSAGVEGATSAAELAFAQLEALWKRVADRAAPVVLVVPGHYRTEQLGLLLGLAQECGMNVRALVDAAAAASARAYPGRQLLYVDAGLHRVSATSIEQGADAVVRAEQGLASSGLASLTDVFARRIAELFVRATRFDPFHHADTEQALYDRLPDWLRQLEDRDRAELVLPHADEEFRASADRDQLLGVAAGFYRAVVQLIAQQREPGRGVVVQLTDRLAELPGLVTELTRLDDAHVERLPSGHAARSVLLAAELAGPAREQVKLLKRLAWRGPPVELAAAAPARVESAALPSRAPPTHVVYRGIAYRVGPEGLVIGREAVNGRRAIVVDDQGGVSREHCEIVLRDGELKVHDLSRYGTFVNEKRVSGEATLQPADVIRVGSPGAELQVVSVEASHGA